VTTDTATESGVNAPRRWRDAGPRPYALVVVLWFLYLYGPFKVIPYYVPPTRPLSWVPELLLWICAIQWLRSPAPRRSFPAYSRFMAVLVLGVGVAFALGNAGVARNLLRVEYQTYLLGLLTLSLCVTPATARPVLALYFGYFLWFGIWGLISLKTSPLGADVDPGARVIVPWHPDFDNRDAFGPLMVAGLAYCIYYWQANRAIGTPAKTAWAAASIGLCGLGFITSFGRGAFLGFLAAVISMWLRSRRKMAVLVGLAVATGAFAFAAPQLANRYLKSMQTITGEGMQQGTGADRADLWNVAWQEFLSSPIVGVGTANYGPGGQRVLHPEEQTAGGYTQGKLFERVPHSAPMRIIAEYGLVGAVTALLIVVDFFRTNRRTRIHAARQAQLAGAQADPLGGGQGGYPPGYVNAAALGLHAAFLSICVCSIFYELLYSPLIWNAIVLNRMLYFSSGADVSTQDSATSV
jgi:O-antigen ligase